MTSEYFLTALHQRRWRQKVRFTPKITAFSDVSRWKAKLQMLTVQQVLKCVKSPPLMWKRLVLPGIGMFKRLYLRQRRLFTFVRHYASRKVSCGMLTKVCKVCKNCLKLSRFLHYPLTVWSHIFTGCNQGGKVTFGNTLYTFKVLHAQLIFQLQRFPCDPKYIDLYRKLAVILTYPYDCMTLSIWYSRSFRTCFGVVSVRKWALFSGGFRRNSKGVTPLHLYLWTVSLSGLTSWLGPWTRPWPLLDLDLVRSDQRSAPSIIMMWVSWVKER